MFGKCLSIAIVASGCIAPSNGQAERVIDAVLTVPAKRLFDSHGNAAQPLQDLLLLRFDASKAVCERLEQLVPGKDDAYIGALFFSLGFVKDASTIDWLSSIVTSPYRPFVYGAWLNQWRKPGAIAVGPGQFDADNWIVDKDKWSRFFHVLLANSTDTERLRTLQAIVARFNDETTHTVLRAHAKMKVRGEEQLVIAHFLYEQGEQPSREQLSAAVELLDSTPRGRAIWMAYAHVLRHEAFVPFLVAKSDRDPSARDILALITCVPEKDASRNWKKWWETNLAGTRDVWRTAAIERLTRDAAKMRFKFDENRWLAAADCMDGLMRMARNRENAPDVARALVSMYRPVYRDRIARVVKAIQAAHDQEVTAEVNERLARIGFAPEAARSWADYVISSNRRL